jgi:hypothetical protein
MAGDIAAELKRFLRDSANRSFDWAECNCGFWVCEWIRLVTDGDPVGHVSEEGSSQLLLFVGFVMNASGGNEAFSCRIAERSGLVETDQA